MASVDSLEQNMAFAKAHNANFPILSDPSKKMARAYGVLGLSGLNHRWTYYINAHGTLVKIDKAINPSSAGSDLARIMEELKFPKK